MTAVSPLLFPGSRSLAGWWKQLSFVSPRALWVGHLLLHRVEALAALQLVFRLDPILLFVLKALALVRRRTLQELDGQLHLGVPLVRQLLRHLEVEQLVLAEEDGTWSLTQLGSQAFIQGSYTRAGCQRRTFYFVENERSSQPPHFLNFRYQPAALAWPAVDGCRFEPAHLQACVHKPAEWKRGHGFPLEVQHILDNSSAQGSSTWPAPAWQRVILDHPERLLTALVSAPTGQRTERLLGFAVQPEGWVLQAGQSAFVVDGHWQEVFPDLAVDLSMDQWRHAWRAWCQPRGLPAAEVDSCFLERQGHRLRVTAGPHLIERLRAARSDVFRGDAWLLAGTGRVRTAAQLELAQAKQERPSSHTPRSV